MPPVWSVAREDGYDLLLFTARAALDAAIMDWAHRDPSDQMIATVASMEKLQSSHRILSSTIGALTASGSDMRLGQILVCSPAELDWVRYCDGF